MIFLAVACSTGSIKTKNQIPEEKTGFTTNTTGKGQKIADSIIVKVK